MKQILVLFTFLIVQANANAFQDGDIIIEVCSEWGCGQEYGGNINDEYNSHLPKDQHEDHTPRQVCSGYDCRTEQSNVYQSSY
ncbi:MAG: hypothetical protein M9899_02350 [Bdellovibrionaceae bacterium]|nr:hypothetical protein [Pseudobdellovibrionaceae bacterium]